MDKSIVDRPLEAQLCFEIYTASNNFSKLYARALKPYGLTFPQYLILLALWDKEEVRIKELQTRLGISIGTLNPVLNHLEREGWIQKRKSPLDKRAVLVSVQPKARQQKENMSKSIVEEINEAQGEGIDLKGLFLNLKELNRELEALEEKQLTKI